MSCISKQWDAVRKIKAVLAVEGAEQTEAKASNE